MGKDINSGVFEGVNAVLGTSGFGSQTTELEDSRLVQTLDSTPFIAVNQAIGRQRGMGYMRINNVHAVGDEQNGGFDFYNAAEVLGDFPTPVPEDIDLWYLWTTVVFDANAANFAEGTMTIDPGDTLQFAGNGSGGLSPAMVLERWDAVNLTMVTDYALTESGQPFTHRSPWRIPRDSTIFFNSRSVGALEADAYVWVASAPRGYRPASVI